MTSPALSTFLSRAAAFSDGRTEPADCVLALAPRAVTSFVPNPDHIHMTGVPAERPPAVSLHLYGRMMNSFNTYDVAAGTRQRVNVAHNES